MNDQKFSISMLKSPFVSMEYFNHERKNKETELLHSLLEKIEDGEYYTIKIKRTHEPDYNESYIYGVSYTERFETELHIGKVKTMQMNWKPIPRKLTLRERFKVLFTGDYLYRMEVE